MTTPRRSFIAAILAAPAALMAKIWPKEPQERMINKHRLFPPVCVDRMCSVEEPCDACLGRPDRSESSKLADGHGSPHTVRIETAVEILPDHYYVIGTDIDLMAYSPERWKAFIEGVKYKFPASISIILGKGQWCYDNETLRQLTEKIRKEERERAVSIVAWQHEGEPYPSPARVAAEIRGVAL